jgi:glycerol-3-phosphate cytidylyltransferase
MITGYTTGVFDMFHIGHLNVLRAAKGMCDYLIVGVTTDELARSGKGISTIMPYDERFDIVSSIRYVDKVVPQSSYDKMLAWDELRFQKMFVGDDWKGTDRWNSLEKQFQKVNVEIVYLPYTHHVSSTILRKFLNNYYKDKHE